VERRAYRLGRRQASVDRTANSILAAASELVAEGRASQLSVGAVARKAGVSRLTIYNRFGSRARLLEALAPHRELSPPPSGDAREALRQHLQQACSAWAANPALYRNLPPADGGGNEACRALVERLAAADALRPGCSLKEAEDVVNALTTFAVFDRLHKDGRRSAGAVGEILMRLASEFLA
jgi:AcrR family transcriptional regulator